MIENVKSAIMEHGTVKYQNEAGLSLRVFLLLLRLYLLSLLIEFQGNVYNQKPGLLIGSLIAPALSEVYLSVVNVEVKSELSRWMDAGNLYIFRFVDDYLVMHTPAIQSENVTSCFGNPSLGLRFTGDKGTEKQIEFLDIKIITKETETCWIYDQRSSKPLLPFKSSYSKTVKQGFINSVISASLQKSYLTHKQIAIKAKRCVSRVQVTPVTWVKWWHPG